MTPEDRAHNQRIIDKRNGQKSTLESRQLARIMQPTPTKSSEQQIPVLPSELRQEFAKYGSGPNGEDL